MFGSHIERGGESNPLSANSSPAIRNAQYTMKKPKLNAILTAKLPFREMIPRGAPIKINTKLATGMENFLWSSTVYLLIERWYELISEKSLFIPRFKFFILRLNGGIFFDSLISSESITDF